MGLFNSHQPKHSHIDRSTGRNKRDKSPIRGSGMDRWNGKVINRAAQRREQKTGVREPRHWW